MLACFRVFDATLKLPSEWEVAFFSFWQSDFKQGLPPTWEWAIVLF